jgi:glycosyltransferase involved in cell wall biosynthesis
MKVLHIIPAVASVRGGPSHAVLAMVRALRSQGVEAEIATTNNNGTEFLDVPLNQRVEYEGVPVWFFPQFSPSSDRLNLTVGADKAFIFSSELTKWLWQNLRNYDLIETHYLFSYASTCAGAIARGCKIPYVVRTIGQLAPWALTQSQFKKRLYTSLIERHNLNQAAAIHCTSEGEVKDVRNFGIQTPTFTLPLGVNPPEDLPEAKQKLRDTYGISPQTSVVLFLSRLHPKKRPDLLINAFNQVAQKYDCHLILAGSGGDAEYLIHLNQLVSSLGLANRTSFTGFVTGEDKALLLQGSDLFVLPSFAENFGVAVAEAMAAGLPVIVTPDVQISPEIETAQAGLVIEGEVDAVTKAISRLLDSPEYRKELGKNGKRLARDAYSWNAIAQKLVSIYTEVIEADRSNPLIKEHLTAFLGNKEIKSNV